MNNIFVSYRREDSEGFARGLFQSLVGAFGPDHVFMDVEDIGLGADFVEAIDKSLANCGALLVLIGPQWAGCTDAGGNRRLEDPMDFVRMEVAKALERGVRVIPVLVKGAKMPSPEVLPEVLQPVVRRQALELRHERWSQDVDHLASALARELALTRQDHSHATTVPPDALPPANKPRGRGLLLGGMALAVVAVVAFFGYALIPHGVSPPATLEDTRLVEKGEGDNKKVKVDLPKEPPPEVKPSPQPSPPRTSVKPTLNLTGMWVDADGVNVQISRQGNNLISQAYDPLNGMVINAVWQVQGRRVAFNWASNMGNQGVGEGTVSADGNTIDYRYVDHFSGEQGYSRLFRVVN